MSEITDDQNIVQGAPPPPSEVRIRTMRSDLESMAKSGGGMPRFQNVAVEGLMLQREYKPEVSVSNLSLTSEAPPDPIKKILPIVAIALVAIAAILGVIYFAYTTLFAGSTATQSGLQYNKTSTAQSVVGTPTSSAPAISLLPLELSAAHISFFKKPADQIMGIILQGSYQQTMLASLARVSGASTIIEIDPLGADKKDLSMEGLLSVANSQALSPSVLSSFNPDATFFVYQDKSGLWPGYILALNAGQTTSSVANGVRQIESARDLGNLFLSSMGTPSANGFTDSIVSGIPIRTLPFGGVSSYTASYFVYGWFGNYLILSTSQNGFGAAAARL